MLQGAFRGEKRTFKSSREGDRKLFSFVHLCPQATEAISSPGLEVGWALRATETGNQISDQETVCLNYDKPSLQERGQTWPADVAVDRCMSAGVCEYTRAFVFP